MPHSLHKKIKGDDGLITDVLIFIFLIWQGFFGSCSNNVLCQSDIPYEACLWTERWVVWFNTPLPLRSAHVTHVEICVKTWLRSLNPLPQAFVTCTTVTWVWRHTGGFRQHARAMMTSGTNRGHSVFLKGCSSLIM